MRGNSFLGALVLSPKAPKWARAGGWAQAELSPRVSGLS